MRVQIDKLKIHESHEKIYQINDIEELKQNIQEFGLLERLKIDKKFVIISGSRRLRAIQALGYKEVDVEMIDVEPNAEIKTLISFNRQRVKTIREILNEAKYLDQIWGKKQGCKSKLNQQNNTSEEPVNTRKKISNKLKISEGQLSMIKFIDKTKPELIESIDKGKISVLQAYKGLKAYKVQQKVINIEEAQATTITNEWYKIINKSSDDLSDIEDSSIQTIFTSPPYFNQRSFTNISDELGAEKTSEEFVQRMATHLHCCYRKLKSQGSLFLNLGDKYINKALQSIPHRVVIELVKKGWILRKTIIWKKTNPISSTSSNLTTSYEFIFHLVKSRNYDYNDMLVPYSHKQKVGVTIINRKRQNSKSANLGSVNISGLKTGKKLEDYWTQDVVTTAVANQSAVKKYGGSIKETNNYLVKAKNELELIENSNEQLQKLNGKQTVNNHYN
jgi:DNA modification methylase